MPGYSAGSLRRAGLAQALPLRRVLPPHTDAVGVTHIADPASPKAGGGGVASILANALIERRCVHDAPPPSPVLAPRASSSAAAPSPTPHPLSPRSMFTKDSDDSDSDSDSDSDGGFDSPDSDIDSD